MNTHSIQKSNPVKGIASRFTLSIFSLFFFSSLAFAGNINLAWDASPSTGVGGYKIYYGTSSKNYTLSADAGNVTSYTMTGLQDGATYYFALKAYNVAKSIESAYSNEVSATVTATATITADFTATVTSGNPGMVVAFTPITTGTISQWLWDFGDGGTSTAQTPTHTYNLVGNYTVSLTATGAGSSGSAVKIKPNFISVTNPVSPPTSNFSVDSVSGVAPKAVSFTSTSTGTISTWLWNFGDGTTSNQPNPTHTYNTAGIYSVSLTVSGAGGSNTMSKNSLITVTNPLPNNIGLVAAYNFEGTSATTATDLSGYANHGIINEAALVADGKSGKALNFDGVNDVVTVNDSPSLDLSTGFTFEAWVKPATIKRSSVLFKEQSGSGVYSFYAYEDADVWNASFNDGVAEKVVTGSSPLPINQWTYIVSTYDGNKLQLYRNGVLESSIVQTGLVKGSDGALRIGGNSIWGEYFQGTIDEVKIYNRALTPAEITADMQSAPQLLIGNKILEPKVDSNPQGVAEAFKTAALKNGSINALQIYLDASSLSKVLVAGIYSDNAGHPGALLAQGRLTTVKAGATNTVTIPATNLIADRTYWIAILGNRGQLSFRDRLGSGISPLELHKTTGITALPKTWVTGAVYPKDGPMSAYGTGN